MSFTQKIVPCIIPALDNFESSRTVGSEKIQRSRFSFNSNKNRTISTLRSRYLHHFPLSAALTGIQPPSLRRVRTLLSIRMLPQPGQQHFVFTNSREFIVASATFHRPLPHPVVGFIDGSNKIKLVL